MARLHREARRVGDYGSRPARWGRLGTVSTTPAETTVALGAGFTSADMVLNIGPQHPATHGVLRLKIVLDGERILKA